MMPSRIQTLINHYQLIPHPEGGYYKETFRDPLTLQELPSKFSGPRAASTSIYFLLTHDDFSQFHRIQSAETWHFYEGCPLEVVVLQDKGDHKSILLGSDCSEGQQHQATVPPQKWFGSRPLVPDSYAFVGCQVSPGFDFDDFEMGDRATLLKKFPQSREIILALTR